MKSHEGRAPRPRIGVSWVRADQAATDPLVVAVAAAGGTPVPLLGDARSWRGIIRGLNGLILNGGNAVDPRRYGQVNAGLCRTVIPQRDELEFETLQFCRERGLPVLGVCRGMQFLNVSCGGSMLQDLPITTVEHEAAEDVSRFHPIEVFSGTRLAALAGAQPCLRVNSRHHQGLRAEHLAPGFRISALAPDGVVEGVEAANDPFLVGIQFHPERPGEVPEMIGLFSMLVTCATGKTPGVGRPAAE
jgi:putative glutamine amidotransferase